MNKNGTSSHQPTSLGISQPQALLVRREVHRQQWTSDAPTSLGSCLSDIFHGCSWSWPFLKSGLLHPQKFPRFVQPKHSTHNSIKCLLLFHQNVHKPNKTKHNKTKQKNKKNKDILGKNHDLAAGCGFPRMIMMNGKQRSWIVKNSHDQTRESRNTGYDNPKFEELTGAPGLVSTLSLRSMLVTNNRQNCALCESMWKGPWERHGIENAEARTLGCARFPPEPPCTDVERPASAMRP